MGVDLMKNMKKLLGFSIVFMVMMVVLCSTSFASTVGELLIKPESGWQRINDTDSRITYSKYTYQTYDSSSHMYKNDMHYTMDSTGSIKFNFTGSKVRIIAMTNEDRSTDNKISIDGITEETFSCHMPKGGSTLVYEKTGLADVEHSVVITNGTTFSYRVCLDAIDISDSGTLKTYEPILISTPTNLTVASTGSKEVKLTWDTVSGAISYNIKRSTASGNEETIATTSSAIYTDTGLENGTTYYYVVTAVNANGESAPSNEVSAKPFNPAVSLEVTSVDKAKLRDTITANVVIHNAVNICAEDIKLSYDTSKLEFVSAEGADGIKVYKEADISAGIKRYITASLGKANAANGDKILLKLTFKAKATGEAKIDVTNGRIADNSTLEMDVEDANCGEKTILIEGVKDVNRSGEFTLLDLGIDAWYYGDAAADTDTSKYDTDVVENGTIDDADLSRIVEEMLSNPNYPAVSKRN
jgi:hypothetical protein